MVLPFEPWKAATVTPRPCYDLGEVRRLALAGRVVATQRVVSWLANHDYDVAATLVQVLSSLPRHGRWLGSVELRSGMIADEYVVALTDEDWYLKFSVDDDQIVVDVWSCCWDGAVH
jgi:hypothetical protein